MANQTRQLKSLLERESVEVTLVRTNGPYRPAWVGGVRGVRAIARLLPYRRVLAREAPRADVVHVMANSGWAWHLLAVPAIEAGKRAGKPVIVNYRGGLAAEFLEKAAGRVRSKLAGARLVVPSPFLQEVFRRHRMEATVVPNVVDTDVFHPCDPQGRSTNPGAPHIVIARALEPIYGIDLALRAMPAIRQRYPGAMLSVAGTGPERERLAALAQERGVAGAVRFTGRLEVAQMVELYRSADLVLNPVRADNTPNSVLEALACGVPVVSTRVGGVPYLLADGESAVLVPPESPEALVQGVLRVLDDEVLRRRLVERGTALARDCAWPKVRERWFEVYRSVAA
jgi:glycosyltransferase involved in cell wall biosynthesis